MTFAKMVRRARGERTQVQFAKWLGVHSVTVSRWESGAAQPSPMAVKLFKILMRESRERKGT